MTESLNEKLKVIFESDNGAVSGREQRRIISDVLLFLEQREDFPYEEITAFGKEDIVDACLKKLRRLNNKSNSRKSKCKMYTVELDKLINDICLCTNVILSDNGISISFHSEPQTAACAPTLIIEALLNLISNAVKFAKGSNIEVLLSSTDSQTVLNVSNASNEMNAFSVGDGLRSVENICRLHGGRLLFSHSAGRLTASMSLSSELASGEKFVVPPFSQYLSDRYSVVYIGLSELT